MLRPLALILAAIELSQPGLPPGQARVIAEALHEQAAAYDFDPLTGISIIRHESGFEPEAVSQSGEDYGLAQIRARYIGACKQDEDPLSQPSPECRKVKAQLLDPTYNIRVMAQLIEQNREYCRKKVGSAKFHRWLASYQGRNDPRKRRFCQPGAGTWKVIEYRRQLILQLRKRGFKVPES